MLIAVLCITLLNTFLIGIILFVDVGVRVNQVADVHDADGDEDARLSATERERVAWNSDFDARIQKMKDELAMENVQITRVDTIAEELHPGVHNLPHDSRYTRPAGDGYEEVAE